MLPLPKGHPNGSSVTKKNSLPAVPWRGPAVGDLRREDGFYDLGVIRIDSCLFLQSPKKSTDIPAPLPERV